MKKEITVHTSPAKLAAELVRTRIMFKKRCAAFEVKTTREMEMAYEAGFGAALLTLGISGESLMDMSQLAEMLRESRDGDGDEDCDCPNCNPDAT